MVMGVDQSRQNEAVRREALFGEGCPLSGEASGKIQERVTHSLS
jgi:hypothetical protein